MKLPILSMIILMPIVLGAQFLELGLSAGGANYLGDLSNQSTKLYLENTGFHAAVFGRYNLNALSAVRLQLAYGSVSGSDALSANESVRLRNLRFESGIIEFSLLGELYIPGYDPYNLNQPFSPYIFGGVSGFSFQPSTDYQGERYKLASLGTEGQGSAGRSTPYSTTAFAIPMGAGLKFAASDKLNIGFEAGARLTFTDYLDDVGGTYLSYPDLLNANGPLSAALGNRTAELTGEEPLILPTGTPRGDNHPRDWYFFAALSISYNLLDNGLVGSRNRVRKRSGCHN
jgi:opacity protein-like surface antigen